MKENFKTTSTNGTKVFYRLLWSPQWTSGLPRNDNMSIVSGSRMAASGNQIQITKRFCRHPASYNRINNLSLRAIPMASGSEAISFLTAIFIFNLN